MMQIVYKLNNLTPEEIKIVEDLPVRNRMQAGDSQREKSMGRSSVYKFISSGRKPTGTAIEK